MGLRELKETAHTQYIRGKFEQCAETYQQILRLAPRDPNMRVRHAEACRRAGDKQQAIASYRMAADLLLAVGCESRARGALKAALDLDPKDPVLLADLSRLGQGGGPVSYTLEEERPAPGGLSGTRESWAASVAPGRSLTSVGVPAPGRSLTLAGVPAPGHPLASAATAAPGRFNTPGGMAASSSSAAPGRSLTSVGVPAPGYTMASVGVPAPGRSTSPTGAAAPGRAVTPLTQASSTRGQPRLALPAAPVSAPPGSSRATSARPSATSPAGASQGQAVGSRQAPGTPGSDKPVRLQAEVRRLSDHAIAFRLSPRSRWVLFSAAAPIQVRRVDSLPDDVPEFTLDITVDEPGDTGTAR